MGMTCRWVTIVLVVSLGCARWTRSEEDKREQESLQLLQKRRAEALAPDAGYYDWIVFADMVCDESRLVSKHELAPKIFDEAWEVLDRAAARIPISMADDEQERNKRTAEVEKARGRLRRFQGRDAEAVPHFVRCAELGPEGSQGSTALLCLDYLGSVGTPETVLEVCEKVRPKVEPPAIRSFVEECLQAADDDRSKLSWAEARDDLRVYDEAESRSYIVYDTAPATQTNDEADGGGGGSKKFAGQAGDACGMSSDCKSQKCVDKVCVRPGKGPGGKCKSSDECRGDLVCATTTYGSVKSCSRPD